MWILCERHIPPEYFDGLRAEPGLEISWTTEHLHPEAEDVMIAGFALNHGAVVFTRDRDFFEVSKRIGCGVLYLDMKRNPSPTEIVQAIREIRDAYVDDTQIVESVPGGWV